MALTHKISIISGGPGTGKTSIVKGIVDILKNECANVKLAAPTGRAARRLKEVTGKEAQTIHRLLKWTLGSFTEEPIEAEYVIIDEASMLDTELASNLLCAVRDRCHLLLVGDIDQLPSVGPGNVLRDMISSKLIPLTCLNVNYRHSSVGQIVKYAHMVNNGDATLPQKLTKVEELTATEEFQFLAVEKMEHVPATLASVLTDFVRDKLNRDPLTDAQVLLPMKKTDAGTEKANAHLQMVLNDKPHEGELKAFRVGDKVMQIRNDYDKKVYNGDIGFVKEISTGNVKVEFDGEEHAYNEAEAAADLILAYATTVHKSQGSEYPIVVFVIMKVHSYLLHRHLLYTAITRGKERVVLVGQENAYETAVKNLNPKLRCTLLRQRLEKSFGVKENVGLD